MHKSRKPRLITIPKLITEVDPANDMVVEPIYAHGKLVAVTYVPNASASPKRKRPRD